MYDWEDEEFYENSSYTDEIEALRLAIRSSIRKEILEEMNRLQEENKKLQGIKEHFESVKRDYERKKSECDRLIANAECNARARRFSELMEDHKMIRWEVDYKFAYGKKCDKCDERRYIKVTLPSGSVVDDICKCNTRRRKMYIPVPHTLYEISDRNGMTCWYKKCIASDGEKYYTLVGDHTMCDHKNKEYIEEWKKHKEKEDGIEGILFDSKEECQNICDELNASSEHPEWIYNMDGTPVMEGKLYETD